MSLTAVTFIVGPLAHPAPAGVLLPTTRPLVTPSQDWGVCPIHTERRRIVKDQPGGSGAGWEEESRAPLEGSARIESTTKSAISRRASMAFKINSSTVPSA